MAGTIANTEKNRLILGLGLGKSLVSPRVPVHRVVGVLEEIRGLFIFKPIGSALGCQH
jgi:hypothetical protein